MNARELAAGRAFTFTVKDRALLAELRPGMNFGTRGAPGSGRFSLVLPRTPNVRPKRVDECCNMVGQALSPKTPRPRLPPQVDEGQADAKGSDSYNQGLSERPVAALKRWFTTKGGLADTLRRHRR